MLTKEQEEKAKIALGLTKSLTEEFEKKIAFDYHLKAVEWVEKYNLPYRLSLNYLKAFSRQNGFVAINPCYPFPGYLKADLIHLSPDEISLHNPTDKPTQNGYNINLTPIDPDKQREIEEHNKALRPWDLATKEGKKKWEYYFAHFLYCLDFSKFKTFDYFGRTQRAKGDNERIDYWKYLQASIHITPDKFMEEEPLLSDYNLEDYTEFEFIPDWEEDQHGKL